MFAMKNPFFSLLRGAKVFAPEPLGVQDILIAGKTIAAIGKNLSVPVGYDCQEIQLDGKCLFPGFIDSHVH